MQHCTFRPLMAVALLCIVVLAGCADESAVEEDRRFANDPVTQTPSESVATVKPDGEAVNQAAPPTATSPDAAIGLLTAENAQATIILNDGNSLQIIDPQEPGESSSIQFDNGWSVLDFAVSPAGGRIAVVLQKDQTSPPQIVVDLRNTRGEQLSSWDLSSWSKAPATPADGVALSAGHSIAWSGESERVLITLGGSALITISLDGDATEIAVPDHLQHVISAAWSPTADQIAIFGISSQGTGTIWTLSPFIDGESLKQVVPPPADAANLGSVTQFSWLPDGSGLLYILAPNENSTNPGGNLYMLKLESRIRTVVATPGRGGPSAQIVDLSVSPDGSSVAYVIAYQSGEVWQFHSLWIRSIETALFLPVKTGNALSISNMWWVEGGFAWQVPGTEGPEIWFEAPGEAPEEIWAPSLPPDSATPVVSSPVASPVASPESATPKASPVAATPEPSPSAVEG